MKIAAILLLAAIPAQSQANIKPRLDRAIEIAKNDFGRPGVSRNFILQNPGVFRSLQEIGRSEELFNALDLDEDKFVSQEEANALALYQGEPDDLFISDIRKLVVHTKSQEVKNYNFPLIQAPDVPKNFTEGIATAVDLLPQGVKRIVFESKEIKPYEVYLWTNLLSDVFPENKDFAHYIVGMTSWEVPRIDISTKVRHKNGKEDIVVDYNYPKNITYHEVGHAFDRQLAYCSEKIKSSKYDHHSSSAGFIVSFNADLVELKQKIKEDSILKEAREKLQSSKYIKNKTQEGLEIARTETFAEIFCMLMIEKTNDKDGFKDERRIPGFVEYFPRCTKKVKEAVNAFESGSFNELKLSSGL